MKIEDLREMSAEDLRARERETREEIFRLRLKLRTNQLESRKGYRSARLELARIMTLISSKTAPLGGAKGKKRDARKD